MNVRIRSLYLCVTDMDRAIDFYEKFLERSVLKRDEVYSVFEADGFRLGLFAFQKAGEEHTFGSNCLPSIEVEDLETLRQKLSGLPVCFPLTRIGSNWVAEFVDSEGNLTGYAYVGSRSLEDWTEIVNSELEMLGGTE